MITFKNKPKLQEHEIDKEFNQKRLNLASHIESFLTEHELFRGKDVTVEFAQEGVSALVCFVKTDSDKYVLKIPLDSTARGEVLFLKKWEEVGVAVPHIFDEGVIAGHPFILMSFIDAPVLIKTPQDFRLLDDEMYIELGKTLALMHGPKAEGYGLIVEGKPQYSSFKEWVESKQIKEKIEAVKAKNILNEQHGSIEKAIQILISYSEEFPASSYCHFDFGSGDIMATKPITIIDPSPIFNMGVLDMALTLMLMASGGSSSREEKFKEGYFSIAKPVSNKVIQAAVVLHAYIKFRYWSNKERWEEIENVKQYLAQSKHFLNS